MVSLVDSFTTAEETDIDLYYDKKSKLRVCLRSPVNFHRRHRARDTDPVIHFVSLRVLDVWLWSNEVPLKETPVYRFWVDNNKDILAYDCGVLWLARNTSVLTAAACAEQARRPYVCKYSKFHFDLIHVTRRYSTCYSNRSML